MRREPEWWARAARLRAAHPKTWTYEALARHFRVSRTTVVRALNPDARAKANLWSRQYRVEKAMDPAWVEANRERAREDMRCRREADPEFRARDAARKRERRAGAQSGA